MADLSAEAAFQRCANLAASLADHPPAYVTYEVATRVRAPSMGQERNVVRFVATRAKDDVAVVQDLPQGRNVLSRSFPVTPTFDALSYFQFSWHVSARGTLDAYVFDVQPLRYSEPNPRADVFVASLRQYRAVYAADSSDLPNGVTHITLTPFAYVKSAVNLKNTLFFTDLFIDNTTGLPAEVRMAGEDGSAFDFGYGYPDRHWVLDRVHYEETLSPIGIAHLHVIADASYSKYSFPTTAPDPRLATPAPLPSAQIGTPGPSASPGLSPSPAATPAPAPS